mmetsp:Transcript_17465/g.24552  ORF Transcript_17465/g.24552 Transcript_17465/m.24552 type:complete len:431 (+) Transcript_17465:168-1460(+)
MRYSSLVLATVVVTATKSISTLAFNTQNASPPSLKSSTWGIVQGRRQNNAPILTRIETSNPSSRHCPSSSMLFMSSSPKHDEQDVTIVTNGEIREDKKEEIPQVMETIVEDDDIANEVDKDSATTITVNENNNDENQQQQDQIQQLFNQLLRIASSTGRGEFASVKQKKDAMNVIEQLEQQLQPPLGNPTIMQGRWELLFSDTQLFRSSPFFMAGRATCQTPDEAKQYDWFCDMHRAALAISNIGTVRQIITSDSKLVSEFEVKVGSIPFVQDFVPFVSYSGGLPLTIDGTIVSTADIVRTTENNDGTDNSLLSYELFMDTVEIKGSNVPLLRQLLDAPQTKLQSRALGSFLETNFSENYENPKPIFTTTFVNDQFRISRDQDGKVFVYGKEQDRNENDAELTDYTNVDSDLGVLKLLEGFNDAITKFYI